MTGFLPSTAAFAFDNDWPKEPVVVLRTMFGEINIGDARGGLCGGMVLAVVDYWHADRPPPPDRPAQGEPLYAFIVRRLVDSWHLPAGVAQYFQWMNLPDADTGFTVLGRRIVTDRGLPWRTIKTQWPQIKSDLDQGIPVALGLVTVASVRPADLAHNHQVLAYGYQVDGAAVTIQVYDPNSGPSDEVTITFSTRALAEPTDFTHNLALDHPIRGFFRTGYSPASPPA